MQREIRHFVIHCSASPNGRPVTALQIDGWHTQRGFHRADAARAKWNPQLKAIGYHYVIYVDGSVADGRHVDEIGAHVQGSNANSIGICMVGTDQFTPVQWASLEQLVVQLKSAYPAADVLGHRDFSPDLNGDGVIEPWEWLKTCPGFDVRLWELHGFKAMPASILEAP